MQKSCLDVRPASQLNLVAEIKLPQDLHRTLVDVDPVGCSKQKSVISFPAGGKSKKLQKHKRLELASV